MTRPDAEPRYETGRDGDDEWSRLVDELVAGAPEAMDQALIWLHGRLLPLARQACRWFGVPLEQVDDRADDLRAQALLNLRRTITNKLEAPDAVDSLRLTGLRRNLVVTCRNALTDEHRFRRARPIESSLVGPEDRDLDVEGNVPEPSVASARREAWKLLEQATREYRQHHAEEMALVDLKASNDNYAQDLARKEQAAKLGVSVSEILRRESWDPALAERLRTRANTLSRRAQRYETAFAAWLRTRFPEPPDEYR